MKPVAVIGMGLSPEDLMDVHRRLIRQADILVGGRRHLDSFPDHTGTKYTLTRDLNETVQFIKASMKEHSVVVLASGDPLFYGIGACLIRSLGRDNVLIYPNITAVSGAFSRIKVPWHDAKIISLHGRNRPEKLLEATAGADKVAVYTDPERDPAWLARYLLEHDMTDFRMWVLEQMGSPKEVIAEYSLAEAEKKRFRDPNMLILIRERARADQALPLYPGMPEHAFVHEGGLITKAEVRVIALSKLRLEPGHVFWDLGAGSGSMAIEAAVFVRFGAIYAVEKEPKRIQHIRANKERFGVPHLHPVQTTLPEGMAHLPPPDRVFVGGGGKRLPEIIVQAAAFLGEDGVMRK